MVLRSLVINCEFVYDSLNCSCTTKQRPCWCTPHATIRAQHHQTSRIESSLRFPAFVQLVTVSPAQFTDFHSIYMICQPVYLASQPAVLVRDQPYAASLNSQNKPNLPLPLPSEFVRHLTYIKPSTSFSSLVVLKFCIYMVLEMASFDRSLRYYKKQIEKLIYSVSETLEQHINAEACIRLEGAETEISQLRASYSETVQKYLLECTDEEFDEKCEAMTETQDSLFESCRLVVAKSRAEIIKFKGQKSRESLAGPMNSTVLNVSETSMSAKNYPKIRIPTFNGEYKQFMRFKGIFMNLVHDDASIPNVRKLYYLQDSLQGEAGSLIEDLPITDAAYEEAWSRVLNRYDNQKALVLIYFRELTAIKPIEDASGLRKLLDTVTNSLNNLKLCGLPADNWGDLVAFLVYQCLDSKTRCDFDVSQAESTKFFSWKALHTFLKGRAFCSETRFIAENEKPLFTATNPANRDNPKTATSAPATPAPATSKTSSEVKTSASFLVTREKCIACEEHHLLIACPTFAAHTPKQRFELVSQNKMCSNCFSRSHAVKTCDSRGNCRQCGQRHHTLLHFPKRSSLPAPVNATSITETKPVATPTAKLVSTQVPSKIVLLPTAVVTIVLGADRVVTARALLDSCSQVNLISENFVKKFQMPVQSKSSGHTSFTGATEGIIQISQTCTLSIKSRINTFQLQLQTDVVPSETFKYTVESMNLPKVYQPIRGFPLADPAFANDPIIVPTPDLLLGAEYFETCMLNDTRQFGSITLRNSQFGWLIIGPMSRGESTTSEKSNGLPTCSTICQIEYQLKRFCDLEDVAPPLEECSQDEKVLCVNHFEDTHARHTDGKFVARLPLSRPRELLVYNYSYASKNLIWSEKHRSPVVQPEYVRFMEEYEDMKHMTRVTSHNGLQASYIIPHHAVFRPESTTTSTRVVFNASSRTASGFALNDLLMVGPTIQPDILDLLLKFRSHVVAFTADIAKMYRCIWIDERDRPLQCILWRKSSNEPIRTYQLNTLTYGTSCASFIATMCLAKLAQSIPETPQAVEAISQHFYMDDLLSGAESLQSCIILQKKVHETLQEAGFVLRKYQCNDPRLLQTLPKEAIACGTKSTLVREESVSVLGVYWQASSDSFHIKVAKPKLQGKVLTRRVILSEISKTFDPMGFAAPFSIRAKIFMQKVWVNSKTWDESLPAPLISEFASYWQEMEHLQQFSITRAYTLLHPLQTQQLVGFCDASEQAMCAVVYVRSICSLGNISVKFCCAKTRVAPIKSVSIRRLELQAAWLLANLISRISRVLKVQPCNISVFSDSKVVLAWLAKPPSTWTIFVRNRVAKITELVSFNQWSYVNTAQNPADLGTRGISVQKFLKSDLWLHGPPFLLTNYVPSSVSESTDLELKRVKETCLLSSVSKNDFILIFDRFSSFTRLRRVIAFIFRFFNNCKNRIRTCKISELSCLSAEELQLADNRIIFVTQTHYFSDVFACLFQKQSIRKTSQLRALNPFLDANDLLRVGGRLRNAQLTFDRKYPVILPAKSRYVELLITHLHTLFFHAQRSFLVCHLRTKFWYLGSLTNQVKKCIRRCTVCIRFDQEPVHQLMGDLPRERVTPSRPFTSVGIDFAGPFAIKCVGHRSNIRFKAYVALFICLSTRAIHLEVVSSLSTDQFLMSFSRFVARRGSPSQIRSDNGTNFVGAASFLQLNESSIANFSAERGIKWIFNPPRAPHRGGIWESAVKSMKKHLLRSTDGQTFTYEEFETVTCRVESMLNSRPLLSRVGDDQQILVLTPGHFLVGAALVSDPVPETANWHLAKRYEIVSRVSKAIWKIWAKDYLSQLQARYRWQQPTRNVTVGDIMILRDLSSSPNVWPLARVEQVYPDPTGLVRTVDVFSEGTTRRRDVSTLVPLLQNDSIEPTGSTPGSLVNEVSVT